MQVHELIALLEKLPKDMEVEIFKNTFSQKWHISMNESDIFVWEKCYIGSSFKN